MLACGQPGETTTSVDGLSGGAITSAVTVPSLTTNDVVAESAAFTAAAITTLDAENLTSTNITADVVKTDRLVVRGLPLFGVPLGAIDYRPQGDATDGYIRADDACRTAFTDQAHVCSAEEALLAFRSGIELAVSLDGAAVNTHSFQVVGQDISEDPFLLGRLFVVNDCDGWTSSRQIGTTRGADDNVDNANRANLGVSAVQKWIDGHMMLFAGTTLTPTWRLKPNIDHCDQVKLACCG